MSKVIEISGTPGVGKSTMYNELQKVSGNYTRWTTVKQIYPLKKMPNNTFGLVKKLANKIFGIGNIIDTNALREAGDRFVSKNQDFLNASWHNIALRQNHTYNGSDLRFKKAAFLYTTVQQVQLIQENKSFDFVLIDEGLIHKVTSGGIYKSDSQEEEKNELRSFLEATPLPDAFIFFELDLQETLRRLSGRNRVINMYKSLSEEEVKQMTEKIKERMNFANEFLKERNVPFLLVDAKLSTEEKLKEVIAFIEQLK